MDGHYCTAYPGRAERSQPPGYGLVLSLRTGLVPRSMQRVTHSPVNSGSLVVNNTACCSASSSSLLSSTTGPIALVTPSRRSPVSRPALRTPRDLFSYRSFRKSRGILAWKFASLSLSLYGFLHLREITLSVSSGSPAVISFDQFRKERKILEKSRSISTGSLFWSSEARKKEPQRRRQVDLPETSLRRGGWHKSRAKLGKRRQDYGSSSLDRIATLYIR